MARHQPEPRTITFYECDHLRQLVLNESDVWCHITPGGLAGFPCGATSVYRMEATVIGQHDISKFVRRVES